jgi:hypothetical protein
MSTRETRTHLAEVVGNEVLPGQPGEPLERVLALWAPLVQKRFELRVHAMPVGGTDGALEEVFPLGCKVLLTESEERLIQIKRLFSSRQAGN